MHRSCKVGAHSGDLAIANGPRLRDRLRVTAAECSPVRPHFDLSSAPFQEALEETLASVDAIHGDGTLPTVPVEKVRGSATAGTFTPPAAMGIAASTREPRLTLLHELGHLLDWEAGAFRSDLDHPELAGWRAAVEASAATKHLREMQTRRTALVLLQPWRGPERVRIKQPLVAYLLRPTEMFARSYSQFIAERAGSSELLKELGGVRSRPIEVLYPEQWNETDFRPIAEEFVALFRKRGWMHEHH